MSSRAKIRDCPCGSGSRYRTCCGGLHDGARGAATPEELMRSRYAAFAVGRGDYLAATLAREHPDLDTPRDDLVRELSRVRERQRFMGLLILSATSSGDEGEVLFHARIFERGEDRSFVELSRFVREANAWRYASGILVPSAGLSRDDLGTLDREAFLRLAERS